MSTEVTCYQYNGLPNVLDKTDRLYEYTTLQANIITDEKTTLTCTLEVNTFLNSISLNVNVNYVKFKDWGGRLTYWFVDTVSREGATWYYHLRLDVLMTNIDLINSSTQIIERSSTISPVNGQIFNDNTWLVPYDRKLKVVKGFSSFTADGRNIVLTTITPSATTSGGRYDVHQGSVQSYILNWNEYSKIAKSFWDQSFYESLMQYITTPIASVVGVRIFPFDISTLGATSDKIGFGDISLQTRTGEATDVYNIATSSLRKIDFGSISIPTEYGDFRDYEPYSNYSVYLPFYGYRSIDIKRFHNGLRVVYLCDITSGDTRISLGTNINGTFTEVEYIMASMGIQIPFTSSSAPDMAGTTAKLAINAISTVATSFTPTLSFNSSASNSSDVTKEGRRITSKRLTSESSESTSARFYNGSDLGQSVSSAISPVSISATGSATSNTFDMGYTSPFVVISYPNSMMDAQQNTYYGRVVMVTRTLSTIKDGFQKMYKPRLNMSGLCVEEYNEVITILSDGIFMSNNN